MLDDIVTILRDGKPVNVEEEVLRKGDSVLLQAGDLVPADLRLTEARGLEVDEWDLTGEIVPFEKRVDGGDVYVYRGSRVTRGNGSGVVIATGEETEYAQCLKQSWERTQPGLPPLLSRNSLLVLALLLPPLALALWRYDHDALLLLLGVAVASMVVLLENCDLLAYAVTARAARAMERSGIRILDRTALKVVGRLHTVCLDKTGVMTTRDLRVKQIYVGDASLDPTHFSTDETVAHLIRTGCALCNDVIYAEKENVANPVDRALIAFARANGTDIVVAHQGYRRVYDKPFDSEARYMACGFESSGKTLYFAKGDPEILLQMCGSYVTPPGSEPKADLRFRMTTRTRGESIGKTGDIVIALAYALSTSEHPPLSYTFLGLVQLENPLQSSTRGVLRDLRGEGIRAVMLTGDRPESALKIGAEAGMVADENLYLTGRQIARMGVWELGRQASYVGIFARLLPSQKAYLIRVLQQRSQIVAMVGDGANDTVALKAADVAVAFGRDASPLAKRVSPILINDLTDLVTIVRGAKRIHARLDELEAIRAMLLISTFLGLYSWMLVPYMLSR